MGKKALFIGNDCTSTAVMQDICISSADFNCMLKNLHGKEEKWRNGAWGDGKPHYIYLDDVGSNILDDRGNPYLFDSEDVFSCSWIQVSDCPYDFLNAMQKLSQGYKVVSQVDDGLGFKGYYIQSKDGTISYIVNGVSMDVEFTTAQIDGMWRVIN